MHTEVLEIGSGLELQLLVYHYRFYVEQNVMHFKSCTQSNFFNQVHVDM